MAGSNQIKLLTNASGTGAAQTILAGQYLFMVTATFGGGNVQLQMMDPSGNWIPVGTAISAAGSQLLDLPAGQVRAVATTATAVYASLASAPSTR